KFAVGGEVVTTKERWLPPGHGLEAVGQADTKAAGRAHFRKEAGWGERAVGKRNGDVLGVERVLHPEFGASGIAHADRVVHDRIRRLTLRVCFVVFESAVKP